MKSFKITIQGVEHTFTPDEADKVLRDLAEARTQCERRALDLPQSFDGLPAVAGGQILHSKDGRRPVDSGGALLLFAPLFGWLAWEVPPQAARELQAWADGRDAESPPPPGDLN